MSVLELVTGGLPDPRGRDGRWWYRQAIRPEGPTPVDWQAVADFLAYEADHGRVVDVVAEERYLDWASWPPPAARPVPGDHPIQCCSDVWLDGCAAGPLLCHGAPPEAARRILAEGVIRCGGAARRQASTWGEPPDYFDYVMFAHARCRAPEAVAASRRTGRDLVPSDLATDYLPAVRFYFPWDALVAHPGATFDGVHPIKIRGEVAIDGAVAVAHPSAGLTDGVLVVDVERPTPAQWAGLACQTALARFGARERPT